MQPLPPLVISDHCSYQLPPKPAKTSVQQLQHCRAVIKKLLVRHNAVIVAHYYTDPAIQALAEETGGCVADSLEMARFGHQHPADTLLVAGVRFMGETAKILSPAKRILMPTLAAECSLDLGCSATAFSAFCNQHQERTVVVYANTSTAVKAQADWVATSSIAVELVNTLDSRGEKILWAPDRYLGDYVQRQTGADLISWHGSCIVHEEFKGSALRQMRALHPDAAVLAHPESPLAVLSQADAVGSTSQLLVAARRLPHKKLIVATDRGIFYKMQQICPDKELIAAPTAGEGATCRSCAYCPWMALNCLPTIIEALENGGVAHEIQVEAQLRERALLPISRMLHFAQQ